MNVKYSNYMILANDFLQKDHLPKAREAFHKSLVFAKTSKEKIDSLFELADLDLQLGYYEEAEKFFKKILQIKDYPGAYYGLALVGENLGHSTDVIIKNYQEAIALDPYYTKAYYYLAHLYFDLEDYAKAEELFLQCIQLEPEDFVTYNDLGSLYEKNQVYDRAKKYFLKSLSLCPTYAKALYNMGVIENRLGNPRKALDYYEKSLEEYSHPYTYLNMSAIYFALKEDKNAKRILIQGLAHHNDSVNLHFNLACAYVHLGKPLKARKELKEAIKINPRAEEWAKTDLDLKEIAKEL